MHPDTLPPPSRSARALDGVLRVLLFPLLRLVWTGLLLAGTTWTLLHLVPSLSHLPNETVRGALRNACLVLGVLWLSVRLFEGKTLRAVGLALPGAPRAFFQGFLLGALFLTAVTAILWLSGGYQVVGLADGATPLAIGRAALLFALVAVFEECLARGVVFRLLEQGLGSWAALVLSALLFGFAHLGNPGATVLSSLAIAVEAGVLVAAAYLATRSLWLPIGLHTAWNFFEGPVYGARVSGIEMPTLLDARFPGPAWLTGGAFGPEAAVPTMLLGSALGAFFVVRAVQRGQIFTPRWLRRLLGRERPLVTRAAPSPPVATATPLP
jgi:membrane protease YdiL (CAAX protease family)